MFFRRKKKLLLSVIIPAYNCKSTLNKAVQSILDQTINDLEVIIVDDGSTDGTSEFADKLASRWKRVKVIHQTNAGPMAAKMKGMEAAEGTWIGFVDSDDYVEPNMYETMINTAIKENVDIVQCNFKIHNVDTGADSRWYWIPGNYRINDDKILSNTNYDIGFMPSKIYKNATLKKHKLQSPDCDIAEDLLFNIEVYYKVGKLTIIDDPLYVYNVHKGSLGHTALTAERRLRFIRACDKLYNTYKTKKTFARLWNLALPFLRNVCIRKSSSEDIDLVIPYVDSSDKNWQNLYTKVTGKKVDAIRFNDYNMFPIFWRCVSKNLKNISIIHLVVQSLSQVPDWLDTTKIHVVTHDMFMPDKYLPTYNSSGFEVFIPQILGLSNKFIYGNDDFYVMHEIDAKNYFKDGTPVNNIYSLDTNIPDSNWKAFVTNSSNLACKDVHNNLLPPTGHVYCIPHCFRAMTVSSCLKFFEEHKKEMLSTVTQFRDDKNINIYVYPIADYVRHNCIRSNVAKLKVVDMTSEVNLYYAITKEMPDIICINATEKGDNAASKIKTLLKKLWYRTCEYEKYDSM